MSRKKYSAEQKVLILREHFEKNIAVPDLCEKYRIHPNLFYRWKKELFEKAVDQFSRKNSKTKEKSKVHDLEATLKGRNEVIAELLEENLKLKKLSGEI